MGWRRLLGNCCLFFAAAVGMAVLCWLSSAADHTGVQLKVLSRIWMGMGKEAITEFGSSFVREAWRSPNIRRGDRKGFLY